MIERLDRDLIRIINRVFYDSVRILCTKNLCTISTVIERGEVLQYVILGTYFEPVKQVERHHHNEKENSILISFQ